MQGKGVLTNWCWNAVYFCQYLAIISLHSPSRCFYYVFRGIICKLKVFQLFRSRHWSRADPTACLSTQIQCSPSENLDLVLLVGLHDFLLSLLLVLEGLCVGLLLSPSLPLDLFHPRLPSLPLLRRLVAVPEGQGRHPGRQRLTTVAATPTLAAITGK